MTNAGLLLALGACIGLAGCGDARSDASRTLHEIGADTLRRQAAGFYKELFAAPTGQYFLPKIERCPPTFRRFHPLRVRAYPDGFALAIRESRGVEEGLYIVPLGMTSMPREGRNARFETIAHGIQWYWFKE